MMVKLNSNDIANEIGRRNRSCIGQPIRKLSSQRSRRPSGRPKCNARDLLLQR